MKGVILAGGTGKRLSPLTRVTNKHLLPVYDRPMIFFPVEFLVRNGIRDLLIVTDRRKAGDFLNLLGSGSDFGARFTYTLQDNAAGIADALKRAEGFAGGEPITVVLGDNIVLGKRPVPLFHFSGGARVFLKEVPDPERYGIAELDPEGGIRRIVEKPKRPRSNLAVTGIYQYSRQVFSILESLRPSARGELEITDVNNEFLRRGLLSYVVLRNPWFDAGTVEALYAAQKLVRSYSRPKGNETVR
jgi:glucose-1-phosphate thymidylyltransferase